MAGRHRRGRCELLGAQRRLDLDGPFVDPSLATTAAQRRGDLRARQGGAERRGRGDAQHLEGIGAGQVVEGDQAAG